MEYPLLITWVTDAGDRQGPQLRSGHKTVRAETDFDLWEPGFPESIKGKLLGLPLEELLQLKFERKDVEAMVEGRGYRFSKLEKDGTFELSIIHQP